MKKNERLWTILASVVFGGLILWYVVSYVLGQFEAKDKRIVDLSKEVSKKKTEIRKGQMAAKRLAAYEDRSLPPDVDLAKSLYHAWLNGLIEESQLSDVKVTTARVTAAKNTYKSIDFNLSAVANLGQVVNFLYRFHEMNWLHRIDRLSIKPASNSKNLVVSITISAVCVNGSPRKETLAPLVAEDWKAKGVAGYRETILNRNIFGPPNAAPKIEVASRSSTIVGKSFELPIKAIDPDVLDRVTYTLLKNTDPPAKLDGQTGKLTWTPSATGDFAFEIQASDDGYPSKSQRQTVQVTVKDPPPEVKVVEGPKKPSFDLAKYTVLTAVLNIDDQSELWLHVQPTGETRKLQTGDKFEIGSVKGEVGEIGTDDATVFVDGKEHRLGKGGNLYQAVSTAN